MADRQEVTNVKHALREAGIRFKSVKHGTGTARGWLHIRLVPDEEPEQSTRREAYEKFFELNKKVTAIAQKVTDRGWGANDCNGHISVS